jgi:hypothetical protein
MFVAYVAGSIEVYHDIWWHIPYESNCWPSHKPTVFFSSVWGNRLADHLQSVTSHGMSVLKLFRPRIPSRDWWFAESSPKLHDLFRLVNCFIILHR